MLIPLNWMVRNQWKSFVLRPYCSSKWAPVAEKLWEERQQIKKEKEAKAAKR
jgi:hypothetical protein